MSFEDYDTLRALAAFSREAARVFAAHLHAEARSDQRFRDAVEEIDDTEAEVILGYRLSRWWVTGGGKRRPRAPQCA